DPGVRVREGNPVAQDLRTEWRAVHHLVVGLDERRLVEHTVPAAECRPSASAKIVSESYPRRKLHPRGFAPAGRTVGIAGEQITLRRIREPCRLQSRQKTLRTSLFVAIRDEGIPAQPQGDRQLPRDAEIIIHEQAPQVAAPRRVLSAALLEAVEEPYQEVGSCIAAVGRSAEAEPSALTERIQ